MVEFELFWHFCAFLGPMSLVTFKNLSLRYIGPPLFDGVDAHIESGDRIGLLGRNGAGKSSLLKILDREVTPDDGEINIATGTRITRLVQEVPRELTGRIYDIALDQRDSQAVDETQRFEIQHAVDRTLTQMELDPEGDFGSLSSGMKRRVLLARAISSQPDILLLDEPTNHLDIESILWLESFLVGWRGTLIFITHDRSFLKKLATRIWEIDRGRLFDWTCDYATFLKRKEDAIAAQEKQDALFDKKLAEEEVWIRKGIKARRTRNEGRVKALKEMRRQRASRPKKVGDTKMKLTTDQKSGVLVADIDEVSFGYDGKDILRDFSTTVMRGDRIGIIGPNGAGENDVIKDIVGEARTSKRSREAWHQFAGRLF